MKQINILNQIIIFLLLILTIGCSNSNKEELINREELEWNKIKNLSDFGLNNIQWFEWDKETDKVLIDEATSSDKLGIEEWDIRDIVENAEIESVMLGLLLAMKKTEKNF